MINEEEMVRTIDQANAEEIIFPGGVRITMDMDSREVTLFASLHKYILREALPPSESDPLILYCKEKGIIRFRWACYYWNDEGAMDEERSIVWYNDGQAQDWDYGLEKYCWNIAQYGVFQFDVATRMVTQLAELEMPEPELIEEALPQPRTWEYTPRKGK